MGAGEKGRAVLFAVLELPAPGAGGVDLVEYFPEDGKIFLRGYSIEDVARAADKLAGLIAEHGVKGRVGVDDVGRAGQ